MRLKHRLNQNLFRIHKIKVVPFPLPLPLPVCPELFSKSAPDFWPALPCTNEGWKTVSINSSNTREGVARGEEWQGFIYQMPCHLDRSW